MLVYHSLSDVRESSGDQALTGCPDSRSSSLIYLNYRPASSTKLAHNIDHLLDADHGNQRL